MRACVCVCVCVFVCMCVLACVSSLSSSMWILATVMMNLRWSKPFDHCFGDADIIMVIIQAFIVCAAASHSVTV